jgi:hypothetical protein
MKEYIERFDVPFAIVLSMAAQWNIHIFASRAVIILIHLLEDVFVTLYTECKSFWNENGCGVTDSGWFCPHGVGKSQNQQRSRWLNARSLYAVPYYIHNFISPRVNEAICCSLLHSQMYNVLNIENKTKSLAIDSVHSEDMYLATKVIAWRFK